MQRREIIVLVAGLIVGLLAGMILVGTSDDLRESLFGTAGSKEDTVVPVDYYLVELEDARAWLAEIYPEESEKFESSVSILAKLPTTWGAEDEFEAAQEQVKVLLPHTYGALVDVKDIDNLKVDPDENIAACLGMDDNPYGAAVYLYLSIPQSKSEKLDIPDEWQKLKRPKTNEMYWKLVACYPELDTDAS